MNFYTHRILNPAGNGPSFEEWMQNYLKSIAAEAETQTKTAEKEMGECGNAGKVTEEHGEAASADPKTTQKINNDPCYQKGESTDPGKAKGDSKKGPDDPVTGKSKDNKASKTAQYGHEVHPDPYTNYEDELAGQSQESGDMADLLLAKIMRKHPEISDEITTSEICSLLETPKYQNDPLVKQFLAWRKNSPLSQVLSSNNKTKKLAKVKQDKDEPKGNINNEGTEEMTNDPKLPKEDKKASNDDEVVFTKVSVMDRPAKLRLFAALSSNPNNPIQYVEAMVGLKYANMTDEEKTWFKKFWQVLYPEKYVNDMVQDR